MTRHNNIVTMSGLVNEHDKSNIKLYVLMKMLLHKLGNKM